jgi:hypothetical protein
MTQPMLASAFTPVTVQFSSLEKNRKGGKVVFLGLPGADGQRQKILMQTPTMALPSRPLTVLLVQRKSMEKVVSSQDTSPMTLWGQLSVHQRMGAAGSTCASTMPRAASSLRTHSVTPLKSSKYAGWPSRGQASKLSA